VNYPDIPSRSSRYGGSTRSQTATKYCGLALHCDHLGCIGSGGDTLNLGLKLTFKGFSEIFDGTTAAAAAGLCRSGSSTGGSTKVSVIFTSKTVAFSVENENCIDSWEKRWKYL
jgi:hypothetical protein